MLKNNNYLPRLLLKATGVQYGKKLKLIGWPFIFRDRKARLEIGDNVTINSSFFSNLLGLYQRTIIIAKKKSVVKIGNRVGISGSTLYAWERIEIGDGSLIGANCKIMDNDFHPVDPQARLMRDHSVIVAKPVIIGKNVFIGTGSLILKGTVIGDNCVIGAGSVVSGKFEPGCIIAGNPAKVIRKFDQCELPE